MVIEDISQAASTIRESLAMFGVHLRQPWIAHCLRGTTHSSRSGGSGREQRTSLEREKEEVYRIFLACDLREAGMACLPDDVADIVKERLKNKMVLQVEGARDVTKNCEQREKAEGGSSAHHTLKLALGDGTQTVSAFEYRRIEGLTADPPPGLKVLVIEPWVRRGMLLLSSENTVVLGGEVSSLVNVREAARNRSKKKGSAANNVNTALGNTQPTNADQGAGSSAYNREEIVQIPSATGKQRQSDRRGGVSNRGPAATTLGFAEPRRDKRESAQGQQARAVTSGNNGRALQAARPAVANPYSATSSTPNLSTARNIQARVPGATGPESRGRKRGVEARVSPFMDDDDGPAFEYLEEEEFDDDMETAQKEAEEQQEPPPIDEDFAITISRPVTSVPPPVSPPQPHVPHAPVTPRSKIVTAKEQNKRLKARESHRERAGENAIDADFECEIVSDEEGLDWRGRSRGKRGRTGSTGGQGADKRHHPPPPGPFTTLADLERDILSGGVRRVKAVVADTVACKIRKRAYRVIIDIEDGTAVMRVRLCESIGKRLFGVDARDYRKMFQADPERAQAIQSRVENDIRNMEGVMDIDIAPAATTSTQSPSAPETPSGTMSQGSVSGDAELLLPVVMSVSPPTMEDYRALLARVQAL